MFFSFCFLYHIRVNLSRNDQTHRIPDFHVNLRKAPGSCHFERFLKLRFLHSDDYRRPYSEHLAYFNFKRSLLNKPNSLESLSLSYTHCRQSFRERDWNDQKGATKCTFWFILVTEASRKQIVENAE